MFNFMQDWIDNDPDHPKRVAVTLNGHHHSEECRMIAVDGVGVIMVPTNKSRFVFYPWSAVTSVARLS